ncbi:MAG: ATP phosphoribosyltransferase regulatory subunit [Actinobacteria bacterium]|nr:ATP phosphoribosyltransferase regulatory subunit [Actinomycetota bacterium]
MFNDNKEKLILKLPFGFRDIFPVEAGERKDIEDAIRHEFVFWGYGELKTPIVELTENISSGTGKKWKDRLISFFDIDGNLISMRADMTIPVARLSGMRLKRGQLPAKFYYFANSFRQSPAQKGQKRVLNQAGLEYIGAGTAQADAEVLIILINILKKLGIKDFKISLGHIKFIDAVCEWFGLDSSQSNSVRENLINKNLVYLREFLMEKDIKKAGIFLNIIRPFKNFEQVLEYGKKINEKKADDSLKYLSGICSLLKELELDNYLSIDLSVLRDFDYYSGLIFEIYCPGVAELLGSGGRYDGLIKKFGLDVPATGFALDMDLLHKSLDNSSNVFKKSIKRIILEGRSGSFTDIIRLSDRLRESGNIVELHFDTSREISHIPGVHKADYIYRADFEKGKVVVTDLQKNDKQLIDLSDL